MAGPRGPTADLAAIIKPTRAGLLNYRDQDSRPFEQASRATNPAPDTLGSKLFKEELIARHSKFSELDAGSIEDRIRANKDARTTSSNQVDQLPDKLLSAYQTERKPFAYSPDVNDPNNRGKLDLAQIKSPIMRRRLLVNMASKESADYDDDDLETLPFSDGEDNPRAPVIIHHPQSSSRLFSSGPARNPPMPVNPNASHQTPVIQYSQAPQFYNGRDPEERRSQGTQSADPVASSRQRESDARYAKLGAELVESLESLSLMVERLHETNGGHTYANEMRRHNSQPPSNQLSSFTSDTSHGQADKTQRDHLSQARAQRNFSSPSHGGLIGDFLLCPDTQYFSTASNTSPYSMSPYYGDSLDMQHCSFAPLSSLPSPKQLIGSTFTSSTTNPSRERAQNNLPARSPQRNGLDRVQFHDKVRIDIYNPCTGQFESSREEPSPGFYCPSLNR